MKLLVVIKKFGDEIAAFTFTGTKNEAIKAAKLRFGENIDVQVAITN